MGIRVGRGHGKKMNGGSAQFHHLHIFHVNTRRSIVGNGHGGTGIGDKIAHSVVFVHLGDAIYFIAARDAASAIR